MTSRTKHKHHRRKRSLSVLAWLLLILLALLGYGIAMTIVAFGGGRSGSGTSTSSPYSLGAATNDIVVSGSGTFTVTGGNARYLTGNTTEAVLVGTPIFGTGMDLGSVGLAAAVAAVTSLYDTLFALSGIPITTTLEAQNVGFGPGIYAPGVYKASAAMNMTATSSITLNGVGDYVFIAGGVGALTFGANDTIILTGGAVASRVFWVTGGAITSGAGDVLKGNFMPGSSAAITIGDANNLEGRVLSRVGVSMDGTSLLTSYTLPVA